MSYTIKVVVAGNVVKRLGLLPGGKVHNYFMDRATLHMLPFLPKRDFGSVAARLQDGKEHNNARWVMKGPHTRYLYMGKVMAGNPKKATDKDLVYTKTVNAQAGPFWDRRMMQSKGKQLTREVQNFLDKQGG